MLEHDRDEDVCLNWDDLAEQDFTCRIDKILWLSLPHLSLETLADR